MTRQHLGEFCVLYPLADSSPASLVNAQQNMNSTAPGKDRPGHAEVAPPTDSGPLAGHEPEARIDALSPPAPRPLLPHSRKARMKEKPRLRTRVRREFKTQAIALLVAIGLGVPVWLLGGLPTFRDLRRTWDARHVPPAPGTHFTILIADLTNDGTRAQAHMLGELLQGQEGLEVVLIGRTLELPEVGSMRQARAMAEREGQQLLHRYNGDVLIWGTDAGKTLQLRFLPRGSQGSAPEGLPRFGDSLEVPRRLTEVVGVQIMAATLSMISPLGNQDGQYLVPTLEPVAAKLRRLALDTTRVLPLDRGTLLHGLATVTAVLGMQTGRAEYLKESAEAYRLLMTTLTHQNRPLDRANVQIGYGYALLLLANRDTGSAGSLERAITELRQAQATFSPDQSPHSWGAATMYLGLGAMLEGERDHGTEAFARSAAAYQDALTVYTLEQTPIAWSRAQNYLGIVLYDMGVREPGTARLDDAMAAHQQALRVRTRERAPLYWAASMNNVGLVLRELGDRRSDPVLLDQAISVLRQALDVRTRDQLPDEWAMTQINLGVALTRAGAMTGNTANLREAIALHTEVLQAVSRERYLVRWLSARRGQGTALMHLGEHEPGTARLEEAEEALRDALSIKWSTRSQIDWFALQAALGRTLVELGARGRDDARLREGIALLEAALPMLPGDSHPDYDSQLM